MRDRRWLLTYTFFNAKWLLLLMLRTDLIEIINRGHVWAFVGSGASIDAGYPSWRRLVEKTVNRLEPKVRETILTDDRYTRGLQNELFPQCFSRIESHAGRDALVDGVKAELDPSVKVGNIIPRLAEWPFAGYITTNYDGLIQSSLRNLEEKGWSSAGNSTDEIHKVSGDATRVVWHIHGATALPREKGKLVLTSKDYDDLYLDDSPTVKQLKGLLSQRRVVFIRFGFKDPEVLRLLKLVGRLCSPARPAFAFLSDIYGAEHETTRIELLENYNVDVIPYKVIDGSHENLVQLLDVYSSFILRRTLRFGQPERPCPSYDPETTSLLVYNQLSLRSNNTADDDILGTILRSRVLSLLRHRGELTVADLADDLAERVSLVHGNHPLSSEEKDRSIALIAKAIQHLAEGGYVERGERTDLGSIIKLTSGGMELLTSQAATATRLSDQFSNSLKDRLSKAFSANQDMAERISRAAESFLKECVRRRALGVAMVFHSPTIDFQQYHMVGLLQALPEYMGQLRSSEEGYALVGLVQDVLSRPSEAEAKFLGTALQAQFGLNLLGYDPEVVQAKARGLEQTLFLIDASTLIPFLGRSSTGHFPARLLLERIVKAGASAATTQFLAAEVAEHARWAKQHVGIGPTPLTTESLIVATGRAGSGSNVFLEGFFEEINAGKSSLDFGSYLNSVCGHPKGCMASDEAFLTAIRNAGVSCFGLEEWEGFSEDLWVERDRLQELIAKKRIANKTFRHERQVKAEAEALIIIRNVRAGRFKVETKRFSAAHFISNTRVIENLTGPELPITMRPEAVLQWLSTITVCPPEELGFLVNGLLWELSERQLAIVDKERLRVFVPLTVAAREKFEEELATHNALITERYGESASKAFNEVSSLEMPIVLKSYSLQRAEDLERELEREKKRTETLQAQAGLTERERNELAVLRSKDIFRKQKALTKRRAAASRPQPKRKKR